MVIEFIDKKVKFRKDSYLKRVLRDLKKYNSILPIHNCGKFTTIDTIIENKYPFIPYKKDFNYKIIDDSYIEVEFEKLDKYHYLVMNLNKNRGEIEFVNSFLFENYNIENFILKITPQKRTLYLSSKDIDQIKDIYHKYCLEVDIDASYKKLRKKSVYFRICNEIEDIPFTTPFTINKIKKFENFQHYNILTVNKDNHFTVYNTKWTLY